jgi:hypothetical protein
MTALIKIEKADTTPYTIMVQVQQVSAEAKWQNVGSPTPLMSFQEVAQEYIHANKRVIVYEQTMGNA